MRKHYANLAQSSSPRGVNLNTKDSVSSTNLSSSSLSSHSKTMSSSTRQQPSAIQTRLYKPFCFLSKRPDIPFNDGSQVPSNTKWVTVSFLEALEGIFDSSRRFSNVVMNGGECRSVTAVQYSRTVVAPGNDVQTSANRILSGCNFQRLWHVKKRSGGDRPAPNNLDSRSFLTASKVLISEIYRNIDSMDLSTRSNIGRCG